MNERVRELIDQAGFEFWEDETWKPEGAIVDWSNNYDNDLEKFAELIVRECALQVDNIMSEGDKTKGDLIKEHFGIE